MPNMKKIINGLITFSAVMLLLLMAAVIYVKSAAHIDAPRVKDESSLQLQRINEGNGFYTLGNNWFRKSSSGLYELFVGGNAFDRGVINGKLSAELVIRQEEHFAEQIYKMVPSKFNRGFLKDFIGFFNRNLDKHIAPEFLDEIYGVSFSASDKFQFLGSNYERLLNYHAAHDIGHALQNLALVGCTSFGTWNSKSADSMMIIGRNFDFYVGDKFSEEKIVSFTEPDKGHKFMSVTWGGFIGAISGMNDAGLAVTINAAKSDYPLASATPVSIVTREILQYAGNIREAIAIAKSRKMFVSESFLVASAADGKAVIIEKTPNDLDVYDPHKDYIICTNHFQSNVLSRLQKNQEQLKESASPYRYERMQELIDANGKITVQKTVDILRDRKGLHGASIGNGNEKAVNQLISHHSIVFEPQKLRVWVSTSPWQLGRYVCYDLNKVFALKGMKVNREISEDSLGIEADPFLQTEEFRRFERFRKYKQALIEGQEVDADSLVASNPDFYLAYVLAGDYLYRKKDFAKALAFYKKALTREIATGNEEAHIRMQIKKIESKQQ